MNTKPIIFSAPMVRALLNGRKTQTRRVVKPQPSSVDENGLWFRMQSGGEVLLHRPCSYGRPGDLLWVRHNFWLHERGFIAWDEFPGSYERHRDGHSCDPRVQPVDDWLAREWRQKPSIHMPRWASRLTLYLTDVRVERVQDITEADAIAEGSRTPVAELPQSCQQATWSERQQFSRLWDSINAKRGYSWADNPWIWVITFRVIHANVDDALADPDRYIQAAA